LKVLWAPWRMQYIEEAAGAEEQECIFCTKPKENRDEENYIVYRGETCFIIMNIYPYNNGHLMIAPYRHVATPLELTEKEMLELMKTVNIGIKALEKAFNPHGFNIGINLGRAAGAGIVDHIHIHVVPRWQGDTNFMPILAETKIIPQHLRETYRKLRQIIETF